MSKNIFSGQSAQRATLVDRLEFEADELEQSITDRFEKIVRFYPDRLAVKAKDRYLTYEALNHVANRIAHVILSKRNPGSEPIALLFEHGIDIIAAIFGTLKAGKFYVALDPSFPPQRLTSILEDSQAGLIVTNDNNVDLANKLASAGRGLANIDEIDAVFCCINPGLCVAPDALAHIMYTSGSTGSPKGAVHTHRALLHNAMVNINKMRICASDRSALLQPVSFGSSKLGLFTSLLNGASLLTFDLKSEGVAQLARWLNDEQITICFSAPAVFRQLGNILSDTGKPANLRLVHLTGAPVTQLDFDLYKKTFSPGTLLEVGIGSTEANQISSFTVSPEFFFPEEGAPAGHPLPGKEVLLLDEDGREVGSDRVGEIAVKSRYVAVGYWGQPELTRAKFLAETNGSDERIYLTGDLGRKLPDGFLIHLGRKDFQVKIRGYRVEPQAIETALLEHAAIRDAVVVARDDILGEKRLVAYVVSPEKPAPTTRKLRMFLQDRLPDYMVPSVFVPLDALPLTPNGKVDRQALPEPHLGPEPRESFLAPRNPTETRLAEIWTMLLGFEQIGIYDNFFDLGGNSLLAMRLFAEIEKKFQKALPLSSLLPDGTIGHLAGLLSQGNLLPPPSMVAIQPHGTKLPFFCIHELFGDVFWYRILSRYLGQDQPFYGLPARGLDGMEEPLADIGTMAANYIEAIRTVQPHGPYVLGGFSSGGVIAFEMAQQLLEKGEAVAMVALFDSVATNSGTSKFIKRCTLLRNLPADIASWLISLWQFTPRERLDLIRFRIKMIKPRIAAFFRPRGVAYQEAFAAKALKEMGELLPYSEQQRAVAVALHRALVEYKPVVYPNRLTLFRCGPIPLFFSHGSDNGWGRLAGGGVEIRAVPGNHGTMLREPHVQVLAKELKVCLDRVPAETLPLRQASTSRLDKKAPQPTREQERSL